MTYVKPQTVAPVRIRAKLNARVKVPITLACDPDTSADNGGNYAIKSHHVLVRLKSPSGSWQTMHVNPADPEWEPSPDGPTWTIEDYDTYPHLDPGEEPPSTPIAHHDYTLELPATLFTESGVYRGYVHRLSPGVDLDIDYEYYDETYIQEGQDPAPEISHAPFIIECFGETSFSQALAASAALHRGQAIVDTATQIAVAIVDALDSDDVPTCKFQYIDVTGQTEYTISLTDSVNYFRVGEFVKIVIPASRLTREGRALITLEKSGAVIGAQLIDVATLSISDALEAASSTTEQALHRNVQIETVYATENIDGRKVLAEKISHLVYTYKAEEDEDFTSPIAVVNMEYYYNQMTVDGVVVKVTPVAVS